MTVRVMFVAPAIGFEVRAARFGDDGPSDEAALAAVRSAAGTLPTPARAFASPSLRCRQTAQALGLGAEPLPQLADLDVGLWRGRSLDEVAAADPAAISAWLSDPAAAPHGGEPVTALVARVGGWLDELAEQSGRVAAVAEPAVVRAAVVQALGLPPGVFWRLDVRPLSVTELSGRAGRWNLRCGWDLT
ncbi:histidine phosphatase family protein [Streptomyces kaniharaensis]|uniref:Histidine phosphatase family protein n=1 Tax=Streptomyces kaniharaensis TaxID=212423 RepID=A0A6N7KIW1_9ACTN|nr:histidine phosphatase family protein [Streptomyces kaniharaensis]MQS11291.1 histidine phosphatase family protein [Streptomyces kaniharaensis]